MLEEIKARLSAIVHDLSPEGMEQGALEKDTAELRSVLQRLERVAAVNVQRGKAR